MKGPHPSRLLLISGAVMALVLTGTACAKTAPQPGTSPSRTASQQPTPVSPSPSATRSGTANPAYGPVWPLELRRLNAGVPARAAALTAIRTGRHDAYDRLVFDFTGAFGTVTVRYVPLVRADPSDLTIPLRGTAFLEITIQHAYARWGGQTPAYAGPDSTTPGYPALQQVTLSGDFENVLSVGGGLDRVAGFKVMKLTPDRLVIDIAYKPSWRMWPDAGPAEAEAVQAAFDQGHQPWRGDVVAYFAQQVYGWNDPIISKITGTSEYWVSARGSTDRIRVRQVWPFAGTHPNSIAEIADVR